MNEPSRDPLDSSAEEGEASTPELPEDGPPGQLPFAGLSSELFDRVAALDFSEFAEVEARRSSDRSSDEADVREHLEELADDMLKLMQQVRGLDERQQSILTRLDRIESVWTDAAGNLGREVDVLRRDLLSDRRHTATQNLFMELIPMLERLRVMHEHLRPEEDDRMISQASSVIESLSASLRRLGCLEFRAEPGEPFDPTRMECLGQEPSPEPGMVTKAVRPGFLAGEVVIRPAGVIIGNQASSATDEIGEFEDE